MTSAAILIAILAVIVGVAKGFSVWNGKKAERLKNAETTNEAIRKGNSAINRADNDDELAMQLRDKYNLRE